MGGPLGENPASKRKVEGEEEIMAGRGHELTSNAARDGGPSRQDPLVEAGRRDWEAAVVAANRALVELVTPVDLDGVPGEWVGDSATGQAVLYLHGGGYNAGSCRTHHELAVRLLRAAGVPVLLVDYRLAPEHPCPAAVADAAAAYRWLLRHGVPPRRVVVGGDSAGGGLAVATLVQLRDDGVELPAAAVLLSPWVDLALSAPTLRSHADLDRVVSEDGLRRAAGYYLDGRDPTDPLASPLYADLSRLPPLLIHVGSDEALLDDATRLAEKARAAGVEVRLDVWQGMGHVFQLADAPAAR